MLAYIYIYVYLFIIIIYICMCIYIRAQLLVFLCAFGLFVWMVAGSMTLHQPPSHDNRKETAAGTGGVKGWRWVSLSGKHMKNHPYLVKGSTPGFPLCLRVVRVDGSWLHDFTSATQNPTLNISSVSLLLSEQKIPGSCWYLACIILNCLCEELREHVHAE